MTDDQTDFAQQYLAADSVLEMPLPDKLAIYYHVRCEHADRLITVARDVAGDARLIYQWQRTQSAQNADFVIRELLRKCPGVSVRALRHAISKYGVLYTTTALEQMLERINAETRERLEPEMRLLRAILGVDFTGPLDLPQVSTAEQIMRMMR